MKIAVGSTNPVKIGSVREAFERAFGEVEVIGVEVSSGVSDQPWGEEETRLGARNRARAVLTKVVDAEYGVGLEGGVVEIESSKLFECGDRAKPDKTRAGLF